MAKISKKRQAKGKISSARCHAKLGAKKDRHVRKSSHGKFNSVAELVAQQKKTEASTARPTPRKKVAPVSTGEASPDFVREYMKGLTPSNAKA